VLDTPDLNPESGGNGAFVILVFTNKRGVMQEDLSYQSALLLFSLVLEGYTAREFGNCTACSVYTKLYLSPQLSIIMYEVLQIFASHFARSGW
jgi:hypothetical protein